MTDPAAIAARLTKTQRRCVYPGPGNPEYARGRHSPMLALLRKGIVSRVGYLDGHWTGNLTDPLGTAVRRLLQEQDHG